MQIQKIHGYYYDKEKIWRAARRTAGGSRANKPLDAITFDNLELSGKKNKSDENQWLLSYINSIPDDDVQERIKEIKDSFIDIDECIVEKLIMEEL